MYIRCGCSHSGTPSSSLILQKTGAKPRRWSCRNWWTVCVTKSSSLRIWSRLPSGGNEHGDISTRPRVRLARLPNSRRSIRWNNSIQVNDLILLWLDKLTTTILYSVWHYFKHNLWDCKILDDLKLLYIKHWRIKPVLHSEKGYKY